MSDYTKGMIVLISTVGVVVCTAIVMNGGCS